MGVVAVEYEYEEDEERGEEPGRRWLSSCWRKGMVESRAGYRLESSCLIMNSSGQRGVLRGRPQNCRIKKVTKLD
jgi:hypothetical protein